MFRVKVKQLDAPMLLSLSGFGKGFPGLCRICIRVLLAAAIRIYFTVVYTPPLTFQFDQAAAILEHLAAHTHTHDPRSVLHNPLVGYVERALSIRTRLLFLELGLGATKT